MASTIHKQLAAKPPIAKAISKDTDISPSPIVTPLVEQDLFSGNRFPLFGIMLELLQRGAH